MADEANLQGAMGDQEQEFVSVRTVSLYPFMI